MLKFLNLNNFIKTISETLSTETPLKSKEISEIQSDPKAWSKLKIVLCESKKRGIIEIDININGKVIKFYPMDFN